MWESLKILIKRWVSNFGYKIEFNVDPVIDKDKNFMKIYSFCKNYTMTSKERMFALYESVKYVVHNKINGDFVECGVWRGGSAMLIALTLMQLNEKDKKIYLYDTFKGMSEPTNKDYSIIEEPNIVLNKWKDKNNGEFNKWCFSDLSEVKKNMALTKYPEENIKFIAGKVEDTIPKNAPQKISLLRLDTDWYESTKHELTHLFPKLVVGGVLIIDDYGRWTGAKKAVDEFFSKKKILLNRIDYTGRIGLKN